MLVAAARRFVVLLAIAGIVTLAGSLLIGALAGSSAVRSITVGFYLVGSFLLVAGFFVGNRGPVRLRDPDAAVSFIPFVGSRVVRWATPAEREDALNTSAIYVVLGLVLIVIGLAADPRHRLF